MKDLGARRERWIIFSWSQRWTKDVDVDEA
jgi:hypothetical protein